ncbi:unnamed protein product [Eruca vesicaria subsp. sativa]|uniref:Zinc finger PHD-type domain-containing protein n=1 Tax=Eruca vesicaria subsp. sativa TaxID=29727 RepID=A0ABC8JXK6_ERUVS|nr:unnamed protein product [Eruca vesicaria subsp. sativa]
MDDHSCDFITLEAERNPESLRKWLSIVEEGKTTTKGFQLFSSKAKKHLSSLGWRFAYVHKGRSSREMRYISPEGKWFYSLVTACEACLEDEDYDSCQEQDVVNQEPQVCDDGNKNKINQQEEADDESSSEDNDEAELRLRKKKKKKRVKVCDTPPFNEIISSDDEVTSRPRFGKSLKTNCDVCCVCHLRGGGDLLRCNGCPSAFHYDCSGLSWIALDEQEWFFCPCCCCKICNQRRTPGGSALLTCEQCSRRWHRNCLEPPQSFIYFPWFCSAQCRRVFSALEKLQGTKIEVGEEDEGLVWCLMRAPNDAVEMLRKSFKATPERFSGRDLVEELMFSRDSDGVGRRFYTVSVERNSELITVGAVRVGKDVAEIPLVATLTTESDDSKSEMCRVVMDELEKRLSEMGVCRLVLPALAEDVNTWTRLFGFSVMESSERLELLKHGLFDFLGTVMCQKFLKGREE